MTYMSTRQLQQKEHMEKLLLEFATKLDIHDNHVIEKADNIFKQAFTNGLVKGRSVSTMICAAIYAACHLSNIPISLGDVCSACNTKRKDLARCYRELVVELDLKITQSDSVEYIDKVINSLRSNMTNTKFNLIQQTKTSALVLVNKAKHNNLLEGRDPISSAATALYIACMMGSIDISQAEIARAVGIAPVTIRNHYKVFKQLLKK